MGKRGWCAARGSGDAGVLDDEWAHESWIPVLLLWFGCAQWILVWCSREDRSNLPAGIRDDDVTLGPSSTLSPHHLCTERWGERGEEAWKDAIII